MPTDPFDINEHHFVYDPEREGFACHACGITIFLMTDHVPEQAREGDILISTAWIYPKLTAATSV